MYSTNTFVWKNFSVLLLYVLSGVDSDRSLWGSRQFKGSYEFHLVGHLLKPLMLSDAPQSIMISSQWTTLGLIWWYEWLSWIVESAVRVNSTIFDDVVCMIMKMVIQAEKLDICGMMSQRLWRVTTATIRTTTVVVGHKDLWRLCLWRNDYRSFWRKEIHILGNVYTTRNIWDMVWQWYRWNLLCTLQGLMLL